MAALVSSWGRVGAHPHHLVPLTHTDFINPENGLKSLAFGNGRSYGDVCLNPGGVLFTTVGLDKFIAFDSEAGLLTCEAGVLLRDIQRLLVPCGWMLPVTPGTQLITVGGAIANDVHGKNHHVQGTFGDHVKALRLLRTDGEVIDCGPSFGTDWFAATVGGIGLTGVILQASIQLRRIHGPWVEAENIPFGSLSEFFRLSDSSEGSWEHTVSWIDCLNRHGRGVFMRANHVAVQNGPKPSVGSLSVPFVPPISMVNGLSLRPFNSVYYQLQALKRHRRIVHYEPFFHPLDNILNWNRMYGPSGFYQYQSVIPRKFGEAAVLEMLSEIARSREGSFLAVLKTFGEREAVGMMSFPRPGVTLALDFPNKGVHTLALLKRLDVIVKNAGGRIYPAKDSCMSKELFEAGYPKLGDFLKYRDPGISSAMSRRLMGE